MDRERVIRTLVTDRAKLLAYAWSMLRDDHTAEDLYQDVLVAALGQIELFNDADHLMKWSRVTLRNKALEHLRRQRTKPFSLAGDVLDLLEDHWSDYESVDSAETTQALRECLSKLTSNARELIEMRYGKGLRGADIANATNRKPHTVYVALSRAYKALGDCINRRMSRDPSHA